MVGDFNLHFTRLHEAQVRTFHNLIESMNLNQLVEGPTHKHGNTLDLIICRQEESDIVTDLSILPHDRLDHSIFRFSLPWKKPKAVKIKIKCRNMKNIDLDKLANDIKNSDLILNPPSDLNSLVSSYNSTLEQIFNSHAPVTEKEVVLRSRSPWYNEHIEQAKRERRGAERKFRKTNLEIHKQIFLSKQNLVDDMCSTAKTTHINDRITNAEKNPKELFRISKEVQCKSDNNILPSYSSEKEMANKFVKYFSEKINRIRSDLDDNSEDEYEEVSQGDIPVNNNQVLRSFTKITDDKLLKIIKSGNSKSCSLDPIPTSFVKSLLPVLLPTILTIVNRSLSESYMPCALKEAIVKPLIKKPSLDKENFKNYRPVSNLAYLGKLIESVSIEQIDAHLSTLGLHEPLQSAYTPNHSTETAIMRVTNDILCALDRGQCVYLVLLDLSAAFDTIDHQVFVSRLQEDYGVTGGVTDWMESYLENRHQVVAISDILSNKGPLKYGFP